MGKTVSLEFIKEAAERKGWSIQGFSNGSKQAQTMAKDSGIESSTTASFLINHQKKMRDAELAEKALDMGLRKESTACYLFDGENGWAVGELKPSFVLAQPDPGFRELSQQINATPSTLSRYLKAFRLLDAPFSAAEFSSVLDIHPKSARKILARCLNAGFIRIESTRAPLRKGRPENLYACDPNVGKRLNC